MENAELERRTGIARILVIDNDAAVVSTLTACLAENGYETLGALNGGDGLMLVEIESPDVVLLDLHMPGLGGFDVLRRLRMVRPDLPVIIVSGLGDEATARQTLRRGAVDYVSKPFDVAHLLRAIAAALGRGSGDGSRSMRQAQGA